MIRSLRGLTLIGIATFILGLLVLFPARAAVQFFVPDGVVVATPEGTVWSGSASAVVINDIAVTDVEWSLHLLSLFKGRLAASVSGTPPSGFVEADVSASMGGSVLVSNLTASLPLSNFAAVLGVDGLAGQGNARFERLEIVDGIATSAVGQLDINDLVVPLMGRQSLGGYRAEFFTQNDGILASIEDTDGVIDLAGSLQLKSDRSFEFLAQVIAKPNTPEAVRRQLRFLPPPNERGQQELRLAGIF